MKSVVKEQDLALQQHNFLEQLQNTRPRLRDIEHLLPQSHSPVVISKGKKKLFWVSERKARKSIVPAVPHSRSGRKWILNRYRTSAPAVPHSCSGRNKLWDFLFGRYFPLLDGCVDFYCELIDSYDMLIWCFRRWWSGCVRLFHWRFENTPLNHQQPLSRVVALFSPFLKALACKCVTLDCAWSKKWNYLCQSYFQLVKADITFEPIENGSYNRRLFFFVNDW